MVNLLFLTVSTFSQTWLEGSSPRKWRKRGLGRDELIEVFNSLKIVFNPLNTVMVPLPQTRMNESYKNNIYIYISVPHPSEMVYAYKEDK